MKLSERFIKRIKKQFPEIPDLNFIIHTFHHSSNQKKTGAVIGMIIQEDYKNHNPFYSILYWTPLNELLKCPNLTFGIMHGDNFIECGCIGGKCKGLL